jgi:hypothetical protein
MQLQQILSAAQVRFVDEAALQDVCQFGILYGRRVRGVLFDGGNFEVVLEPVYFHFLMQQLHRPEPNAFTITPDQFESDVVGQCLVGAVLTHFTKSDVKPNVSVQELLPHVRWGAAGNTLAWREPPAKEPFLAVKVLQQGLASTQDFVAMFGSDLPAPGVYLNHPKAMFADLLLVLPCAVLMVQVKISASMAGEVEPDQNNRVRWSGQEDAYPHEAAKAGLPLPGHPQDGAFTSQKELAEMFALGNRQTLFLLWTNKHLAKDDVFENQVGLSTRHGIVSFDNFDRATSPYQLYFRGLSPRKVYDVDDTTNAYLDLRPSCGLKDIAPATEPLTLSAKRQRDPDGVDDGGAHVTSDPHQ